MLINLNLKDGTSKAGNRYFMVSFTAGKYKSEPQFIDELQFDYLTDLLADKKDSFDFEKEN